MPVSHTIPYTWQTELPHYIAQSSSADHFVRKFAYIAFGGDLQFHGERLNRKYLYTPFTDHDYADDLSQKVKVQITCEMSAHTKTTTAKLPNRPST